MMPSGVTLFFWASALITLLQWVFNASTLNLTLGKCFCLVLGMLHVVLSAYKAIHPLTLHVAQPPVFMLQPEMLKLFWMDPLLFLL